MRKATVEDRIIERAAMRTILPWVLEALEAKRAAEAAENEKNAIAAKATPALVK